MFTFINPEDPIKPRPLIVVIYGRPGIGKTSLAFTAHNPLLLDFDEGIARSVKRKKAVQFEKWADVQKFMKEGRLDVIRDGTVIIDTAKSMLDDFIGSHVISDPMNKKKAGGISQTGYGAMKDEFAWFLRETKKYNVDVIFLAHVAIKGEKNQAIHVPAMTGGSFDLLISKADLIGYMETRNNRRVLDFSPSDTHIGKNCAEFDPIDIPHYTSREYATLMEDILDECRNRMNARTEEMDLVIRQSDELENEIEKSISITVLNELLPRIAYLPEMYRPKLEELMVSRYVKIFEESHLNPISTAEGFNSLVPSMNIIPEGVGMVDVRKTLKKMLHEKAVTAGFIFDGKSKQYVSATFHPDQASA